MQKKYFLITGGLALVFFLSVWGCTFDNQEEYFGVTECDTVGITYTDLTYIFTGICTQCHYPENQNNPSIVMDNYNNVKASFETDLVLQAIKHTGPVKMPPDGYELSECDIQKIEAWFNAGMPEQAK